MAQTTTSQKFTLNVKDLLRGLLIAVITAVITAIYEAVSQNGLESIEWKQVLAIAVTSGLAYLIKNFFTPAEIVVINPPESQVTAVKQGISGVVIQRK